MAALFFIIIKASDTGIILMVCDIIGLEPSPGLREGCHKPKKTQGCRISRKTGIPRLCVYSLRYSQTVAAPDFRTTSWAPPSTIDVAETSVILAFFCRSGMLFTPTLHIVDLTL